MEDCCQQLEAISEQKLIRESRAGSHESFAVLVRCHEAAVRLFLTHALRDADAADDLAQEVFLCSYLHLSEFRGEGSLRSWFQGIARKLAAQYLRTAIRRRARECDELVLQLAQWRMDQLAAEPWQAQESDRTFAILRDCIERLSPAGRDLVDAHYFQGHKLAAIAERQGREEGAVRVMLHRVRKALRECMSKKLERLNCHGT